MPTTLAKPFKTVTTLSSRQFNQEHGKAKKAAENGPVFITDRGRATHVLLSIDEYNRLEKQPRTFADAVAMPEELWGEEPIDFDPPKMELELRIPDFS